MRGRAKDEKVSDWREKLDLGRLAPAEAGCCFQYQ